MSQDVDAAAEKPNSFRIEAEALAQRAVELQIIGPVEVQAALVSYLKDPRGLNFSSYLLEKKILGITQVNQLSQSDDDATAIGDTSAGEVITKSGTKMETSASGLVSTATGSGSASPALQLSALTSDGEIAAGAIVSGCEIVKKLGAGGMGSVYLARRLNDSKEVVVKFLATEQASNPKWRARFLREAQVMQSIAHPNIVELFAVDAVCELPHLVMELVNGIELKEALDERGRFAPLEAARITRDLALALARAHSQGVVHRDIKPANALLTKDGRVKLLDFGIAKSAEIDDGLSMAGQILGTPHYMAPEQWGDHEVDARCDIFSLGATLYHIVTGALPFAGASGADIAKRARKAAYAPLSELVPDAPADLGFVLHRMLEPERQYRYSDAADVARDLTAVLEGREVDIPRLVSEGGKAQRHVLLPGASFTVGRDGSCTLAIADGSVSRQHAEIQRSPLGFLLRDSGSSYGTFVDEMRIREVVLKSGDKVRFGKKVYVFFDGGLGRKSADARADSALSRGIAAEVYAPVAEALATLNDRRVTRYLISQLAPKSVERAVEAAWQTTRRLLGAEHAHSITKRMEAWLRRAQQRVPAQLFAITRENLGSDPAPWLGWWDSWSTRYPEQATLCPRLRPLARLQVQKGEPSARTIVLGAELEEWTLGRDESATIPLNNLSVSRVHATIRRMENHFIVRDEGSRFGTQVNSEVTRIRFLKHGDEIAMGQIRLVFQEDFESSVTDCASEDPVPVPAALFFAAVEEAHPSVTLALGEFLSVREDSPWLRAVAQQLESDEAKVANLCQRASRLYQRLAPVAREALSRILAIADSPETNWSAIIADHRDELPSQITPQHWFPIDATRSGTGSGAGSGSGSGSGDSS
jgi:serine/threonine protein kinase